ncbi:alkaline phosphatase family protein [Sulfuriferula thiophila]|uniref:alkaline phosphatase family protein n=1 Tax=Sulfuriferula thiophila TaxID=1781211 RepID=UPI000F606059|nr:alkaline phosphatase family protein [Sulfuriferula thiophila]
MNTPALKQICLALAASLLLSSLPAQATPAKAPTNSRHVIIFVWDGLRPDSVTKVDTPNLYRMRTAGVNFTANHATYPTFTMMNAASFATGSFPEHTGFYGNTVWHASAAGKDAHGKPVDFQQPQFTEDYGILDALNASYNDHLLMVGTLFQAAQARGITTAAIGKSGPAYMQDFKRGGLLLDERTVLPLSLAQELQAAGIALPKTTPLTDSNAALVLKDDNGDPTAADKVSKLDDKVTTDPTNASGSPYSKANAYMMHAYLGYILPAHQPGLSVVWMRNPDSTQHNYGPGTANALDALHAQDQLLGELQARLKALKMAANTDIVVVSDHGHSSVAGDADWFPLRVIADGKPGQTSELAYSVSGDVRTADLLTRAGFTAFDGNGCVLDPVMSGIRADNTPVYVTQTDNDGSICGKAGQKYTTASFKVPATLPLDKHPIVIAANGGSDYLYLPDHDADTVAKVVRYVQSRPEYGAVFIDSRYGKLPGTLPLQLVHLENTEGRNPDMVVSFNFNDKAVVQGMPGTEYESAGNNRGMHGSFSPIDVHNTLIAYGPDFRRSYRDVAPSGNVDVAPTIAHIMGLKLAGEGHDGRVLVEALRSTKASYKPKVTQHVLTSSRADDLKVVYPTDPDGKDINHTQQHYQIELNTHTLYQRGKPYTYFDSAKAIRN